MTSDYIHFTTQISPFSEPQNPGNSETCQSENRHLTQSEVRVFEDEKLGGECVLKCTNGAYSMSFTQSSIVTHYGEWDTALESGKPHRCIGTPVATEQHGSLLVTT